MFGGRAVRWQLAERRCSASVLPADFPRDTFERLLGFGRPGDEIVAIRELMNTGVKVEGGFGAPRAFKGAIRAKDIDAAHKAASRVWGHLPIVMDPMAGGGSIPLESARLGFPTLANEYNPVACSVLEATLDYPFRFGPKLADRARHWGREWEEASCGSSRAIFSQRDRSERSSLYFCPHDPLPDDRVHDAAGTRLALAEAERWHPRSSEADRGQGGRRLDDRNPPVGNWARRAGSAACTQLCKGQRHQSVHGREHPGGVDQGEGTGGPDGQLALRSRAEDAAGAQVPACAAGPTWRRLPAGRGAASAMARGLGKRGT